MSKTKRISLRRIAVETVGFLGFFPILLILFSVSILARAVRLFREPAVDVGIGPEPIINNVYHKRALVKYGWSAETYVSHQYFITSEFDYSLAGSGLPLRVISYFLFIRSLFRFKILYIYFNGGPLGWTEHYKFEAFFLRTAGIKTVVMPYGADVHDLSKTTNLAFKQAVMQSYPEFQKDRRDRIRWQVDYWSQRADHIVSGCDWVEYMWHWDSLVPAHFAVDIENIKGGHRGEIGSGFRILHAPNHREIKGTQALLDAVESLKNQGLEIELVLAERVPNQRILELINECDLVVDQLVIGWYGMFAVEAMALERPVVCYLREDFKRLYVGKEHLGHSSELPIICADTRSIEAVIKSTYERRTSLADLGRKGREYVRVYHSLEAIGGLFDQINRRLIPRP